MSSKLIDAIKVGCPSCGGSLTGSECASCGSAVQIVSHSPSERDSLVTLEDALVVIEHILTDLEDRASSYHYPHLRERKFDELRFELREAHRLRDEVSRWSIIFIAAIGAIGSFALPVVSQTEEWFPNQNTDEIVFWASLVLCVVLAMSATMMIFDASVGGNAIADTLFQDEKRVVIDDVTDAALRQESRSRAISNISHNTLLRVFDFWQRFSSVLGEEHQELKTMVAQILDSNFSRLVDGGQVEDIARLRTWCETVLHLPHNVH